MKRSDVWVALASLLLASTAAAFVPAACEDDPTRTLFAGFGNGPCKEFHGDQTACESAYYLNRDSEAVSCAFVAGTCIGCGGSNGACATNTCTGASHPVLAPACAGDPGRTALLGFGDNGSERCRNLDHTDQAACENAYYEEEDDDDLGDSVACFWDAGTGACVGCGDNGSPCPFNQCDPTIEAPDAECTLDPERTNLLGYGRNDSNRCRHLDDTDATTCNSSYYEDDETGLPVACWWDGDDCRGSGSNFFAYNACLTSVPPPVATATCRLQPGRSNLLGFGNNDTGTCRQLDDTDEATCENAYYQASASGVSVACWWDGDDCRGTFRDNSSENACENGGGPAATCAGRTNLLGFGNDNSMPCRALDATDATTCEDAFYEHDQTHAPVACWWDGDECRGSTGNHSENNTCITAVTCSLDAARTDYIGRGNDGQRPCRDLTGTGEAACEAAYYGSFDGAPAPVACWWDGEECRGSLRHFDFNSCLYQLPLRTADAACGARANLLGFGENRTGPCRNLDDTDEPTCEDAYYENEETGFPIACWWDGDECRGSSSSNSENNDCPPPASACTLDPERSNLIGFGDRNVGQNGGACRQLDGSDEATCEDAFYINQDDSTPVACWWEESSEDCRGSSSTFAEQNACLRAAPDPVTCAGRGTLLGFGNNGDNVCRQLDGSSESACEDAFYINDSNGRPTACAWSANGDCLGTSRWEPLNVCDPIGEPADCGARTLIGQGNRDNAPCRQFDSTSEGVCEGFYYLTRSNEPVACWWDGNECRGSNDDFSSENACVPPVTCEARSNRLGFGANGSSLCPDLDNTDEATCENAFYVAAIDASPVACNWNPDNNNCDGCYRSRNNSSCRTNACDPVECTGDDGRTQVGRCMDIDNEGDCEDAWHITKNGDLPPIAASCFWSAEEQECRGCGPLSQSSRECANTCEDGCGNGVLDAGETCDDGNMFPDDCCSSTCQLEPDGATCTDQLFCTTGSGTCQAGVCVGGEPRICASCLGGDCSETENECVTDGEGSGPGDAQLQGGGPPPPVDMSFPLPPGTECDDGIPDTASTCNDNGMCVGELAPPTATPSATPTRVPVGAPCTDTSQCVDGAACVEGFCSAVAAPAPAASNYSLLVILGALLVIGAASLRLRRDL